MTAIVGIRCKDGVVIGADSSATFGDGGAIRTIEQKTERKIEIVGNAVIVAGTGYVGHMQRFNAVVQSLYNNKEFMNKPEIEIGKLLSLKGIEDFQYTRLSEIKFTAFIAFPANNEPALCELPGSHGLFQPEIKMVDDLWFTSAGSGQMITDPFLALMRRVFWSDGAPNVQGGIFTAMWALQHACEINPGGINEPVKIAVLSRDNGKLRAKFLEDEELAEHRDMVASALTHMGTFRDLLEGKVAGDEPPKP